ncbi:MAG: MarR family winged helix-turn-helix transcriptional regulator [Armatimonadota bacterium]
MKLLEKQNKSSPAALECAAEMMETMPLVMREMRQEIRRHRPANLSVPQFRIMLFLHHHGGVSLSAIAEHVGVMAPTASKLVEGLVQRAFITRETAASDRRRVTIQLTTRGIAVLEQARGEAMTRLGALLAALSDEEQVMFSNAMRALRRVLLPVVQEDSIAETNPK